MNKSKENELVVELIWLLTKRLHKNFVKFRHHCENYTNIVDTEYVTIFGGQYIAVIRRSKYFASEKEKCSGILRNIFLHQQMFPISARQEIFRKLSLLVCGDRDVQNCLEIEG